MKRIVSGKRKTFLAIFSLLSVIALAGPLQSGDDIARADDSEILSQRTRYSRTYDLGDGTFRTEFVQSPEYTLSNGEWIPYVFTEHSGYYQIQHPWSSARFYDDYTEVWNEAFTSVRVYDDRWNVEYKNKQGNWVDTSFYGIVRSYQVVSDGIKVIRTGSTDIGQRKDIYYYQNGSPCKIEIQITPTSAKEVRFVWQQSGIVASSELSEIDETTGKTSGIRFTDSSGKNVWICRWTEELNIVDNVTVIAESHAQGRKATVTFESISISAGQTAILDPDTFYPDASAADGYVARTSASENWATIRAGNGTTHNDTAASEIGIGIYADATDLVWWNLYRSIFSFDTSSIPDGNNIDAAVISLYGTGKQDGLSCSPSINVYSASPAADDELANGDFQTIGTTPYCDAAIGYAVWAVAYNDFTLNATGRAAISKTGVSHFGFRDVVYDAGGTVPNWVYTGVSNLNVYYSNNGTNKPKLVVTHSAPIVLPTVTTQAGTNIEDTTATGNGNITDTGGENCDKRGIVWDLASHAWRPWQRSTWSIWICQ